MVPLLIVERGRITHFEMFEIDDVDTALARFAELRPDPLRIPPNAATRANERRRTALETRDWAALDALCAPDLVFEDRRRLVRTRGGRDMFLASGRHVGEAGTRIEITALAIAGDRLALSRARWHGDALSPDFEMEALGVTEVDAEGRLAAVVTFDPDDRRAASRELLERYARSEEAQGAPAAPFELRRAVIDHDLDRVRAVLPDEFVFHDHRRTGPGRIEGAENYICWLASLLERSPDAIVEPMYTVAKSEQAVLDVGHTFGTLADGGAFEFVWALLALFRDGELVGLELFEIEDLDVAWARFDALPRL
jgi:ketosteroid isomerase-like protein